MRKLALIFCFLFSMHAATGQQFLWSTTNDTTIKHVELKNVQDEVLKFYDLYDFYYDGSGFSKEGFFNSFENSKTFKSASSSQWSEFKKKIKEINEPTVFAVRDNLGHGSVILLFFISKNNVNMLLFSNRIEQDAIVTSDSRKEKFLKLLQTLLD